MEIRNAFYLYNGDIDCEINHPDFGWIPFTASETDVEKIGRDVFNEAKIIAEHYIATDN